LVEEFKFKHISTGDLLRDEVKLGGPEAGAIEECQKEGKLVSSEILVKLIKRTLENKLIGKKSAEVILLLYFNCSLETMEKRLLKRGETSGRSDDNAETIKKRFATFQEQTEPVLKTFKDDVKVEINADKDVDEVTKDVKKTLKKKKIK